MILVVLGVGAAGLAVTPTASFVVVVTRGRRLGEGDARQLRKNGDVEGDDARVPPPVTARLEDDGARVSWVSQVILLRRFSRSDRGRVDRQLVATRGQLLTVLVESGSKTGLLPSWLRMGLILLDDGRTDFTGVEAR